MLNFDFLLQLNLFRKGLSVQKGAVEAFWAEAGSLLAGSGIEARPLPKELLGMGRNLFSVLFIAAFMRLDIPEPRLRLYARINHCLRSWVTACDNLLDNELKETLLTDLPEQAQVFKSVHTLMVADRIFFRFLLEARDEGVIDDAQMRLLLHTTLASLSESGREEAEEEGGVDHQLPADEVLNRIHRAKTALLFAAPLAAPRALGDIRDDDPQLALIENGLMHFGLACQLVDDLDDLGVDIAARKYNYLIALIHHGDDETERNALAELEDQTELGHDPLLYQRFPLAYETTRAEIGRQFSLSLRLLNEAGYGLGGRSGRMLVALLLRILGHPEIELELD